MGVRMDKNSWEIGYEDGFYGNHDGKQKAQDKLAYESGYVEGKAESEKDVACSKSIAHLRKKVIESAHELKGEITVESIAEYLNIDFSTSRADVEKWIAEFYEIQTDEMIAKENAECPNLQYQEKLYWSEFNKYREGE